MRTQTIRIVTVTRGREEVFPHTLEMTPTKVEEIQQVLDCLGRAGVKPWSGVLVPEHDVTALALKDSEDAEVAVRALRGAGWMVEAADHSARRGGRPQREASN